MKTAEVEKIGEQVDIRFNENGFCVITVTDLKNFANKASDQEKQALKEKIKNELLKNWTWSDVCVMEDVISLINKIDSATLKNKEG